MDACLKNRIDGQVNYQKCDKLAHYVREVQNYQQKAYEIPVILDIQDYIRGFATMSEDEAYENSLICEPRVA